MSFIELLFSNLQSSFEMLVILFETLVKTFLTKKYREMANIAFM